MFDHYVLKSSQSQMTRDVSFGDGARQLILNYHMGALGQVKKLSSNFTKQNQLPDNHGTGCVDLLIADILRNGTMFGLNRTSSLKISNKFAETLI